MNNRIYTHRKYCARHMLLIIYSYLRQAAKKRHCEGQRGKTEKSWPEKRKTNMARRRGTSREPRKKGRARNFPYMGTRVRARRPAGRRSIGRGIDPGPRAIVTSRVDRAAARHDRPRDRRPRKNAETHERGQVTGREREMVKERRYKTMGRSGIKRNVRNK